MTEPSAPTQHITVTLPLEVVQDIDRQEEDRSHFILEAIRHELDRRRRPVYDDGPELPEWPEAQPAECSLTDLWSAAGEITSKCVKAHQMSTMISIRMSVWCHKYFADKTIEEIEAEAVLPQPGEIEQLCKEINELETRTPRERGLSSQIVEKVGRLCELQVKEVLESARRSRVKPPMTPEARRKIRKKTSELLGYELPPLD